MSKENALRLSVLDQSPVPAGQSAAQALENSISLASHADALGYTRLWISEHHAMETLASSAPEILLARIGAETSRIRIGSGGIMLPHYSPLKVAEVFQTLHSLYPDRIDLGIGRAPGGGPIESQALRRNRTAPMPDDFAEQLHELIAFLHRGFPPDHPFSRIDVSPKTPGSPAIWLLGSSMWSADAAASFGLPYAFAHFFSPDPTRAALELYRRDFKRNDDLGDQVIAKPQATLAIGVICAETAREAEYLAASVRLLQQRIRYNDRRPIATPADALLELPRYGPAQPETTEWPRIVTGTPEVVRERLTAMASALALDELIINTITHDHAARLRSYTLLAEAFELHGAGTPGISISQAA